MFDDNERPESKAIKSALHRFMEAQYQFFWERPLKVTRMALNASTWAKLDHIAWYVWMRDLSQRDIWPSKGTDFVVYGIAIVESVGPHRLVKLRNDSSGDWCALEVGDDVPENTIRLICDSLFHPGQHVDHDVDIAYLLAPAGEKDQTPDANLSH